MPFADATFHEKSAAAMLALWLAITGFYIVAMQPWTWSLHFIHAPLKPLVVSTLAIIVGSIVVQSVLAMRLPAEASAPADERERPILDRARAWSCTVLSVGCVLSILHYLQHRHGDLLFHTIYLSLLLSALAEFAFQLWLFRRERRP